MFFNFTLFLYGFFTVFQKIQKNYVFRMYYVNDNILFFYNLQE